MKKIVIAPDSFKESMTALEACHAIAQGLNKTGQQYDIDMIPMADGGEGTIAAISSTLPGVMVEAKIHGPLNEKINGRYLLLAKQNSAVIEVAEACGLDKVKAEDRNPLKTTTYGVGELILDALKHNVDKIYIGLGGSSTNDGGLGLLRALGARFKDFQGQDIETVEDLIHLAKTDFSKCDALLSHCQLVVLSDVDNPFTGEKGATYVFGRQKGANDQQLKQLENCLERYRQVIVEQYDIDLNSIKKTGAAGGLGGAFYLLHAHLQSGIETILELTDFKTHIQDADYIITGEGSIDAQTAHGKTISGILKLAQPQHIPVIALAGRVTDDIEALYDMGLTAAFSITNEAKSLDQALADGKESLSAAINNIFRLLG